MLCAFFALRLPHTDRFVPLCSGGNDVLQERGLEDSSDMQTFKLKKGLELPVQGAPEQTIQPGPEFRSVGVLGADYLGLKPRMLVQEGEEVQRGTPLFCHKDVPEAMMVAPLSGKIVAINRGARRVLQSVVIEVSDVNDTGLDFSAVGNADTAEGVTERLCAAGLWTAFRTRPYSKMPAPGPRWIVSLWPLMPRSLSRMQVTPLLSA